MLIIITVTVNAAMFWLFYILLQIIVWNCQVRETIFQANPIIDMGAGALNDVIWLPMASALPVYIVILVRKIFSRLILREGVSFFFLVVSALCFINIDFLFRMQFVFICFFASLWAIYIYQSGKISVHFFAFSIAILLTILHYKTQLLPPLTRTAPYTLSIMSFNLNTKSAYDDERTIQFIRHRLPDIVFLQELTAHEKRLILTRLGDFYPYFLVPAPRMGKNDVMVLSREELLYGDHIALSTSYTSSFHAINHAVIRANGQFIHLLNCHLSHAYKQLAAYLAAPDSIAQYDALVQAYRHHRDEAALLAEYADTLSGPVIIAGDFNDTPNGHIYALLNKKYQNAFAAAGWGLGATFGEWSMQSMLPRFLQGFAFDLFRIDHLFFSHHFDIRRARVKKVAAFDHHPQVVYVTLKNADTRN